MFKRIYLIVLLSLFFTPSCLSQGSETITLTTYYPSPYGVYQCLRLYPDENCGTPAGKCDCDSDNEGTMCYNGSEDIIYICDGSDWRIASGLWELNDAEDAIYPHDLNWKVGVGTDDPRVKLEVKSEGLTPWKIAGIAIQGVGSPANPGIGFIREGDNYPYVAVIGLADNDRAFSDDAKRGDLTIRPAIGGDVHIASQINDSERPTRVIITNDGRVGIGTVDPGLCALDVDGGIIVYGCLDPTVAGTGLITATGDGVGSSFDAYSMINLDSFARGGSYLNGTYGLWHEKSTGNFSIRHSEKRDPLLAITKSGNVGIGMAKPGAKLQVKTDIDTYVSLGNDGPETGLHIGKFNTPLSAPGYSIYYNFGADRMTITTSGKMEISTHGESLVMQTLGGNVGIGKTPSPSYRLDVLGGIHCTGKLTSDGGNDPAYVLYNNETRQSIRDRVKKEVPEDKLDGAVLFWNGELEKFEVYLPAKDEFRGL